MPETRIRAVAERQGLNMSQLQRRADISMNTVRRYWYGTKTGTPDGEQLDEVSLKVMRAIARVLGVANYRDLLEDWQTLQSAAA